MKLKKINAVISLFTAVAALGHIGTMAYTFVTSQRINVTWLSWTFMGLCSVHAVLGMIAVFMGGDGTRANLYPEKNAKTVVQRITAALIFPLLILHINTFTWGESLAENGQMFLFWLLILAQVMFFLVVLAHTGISVPKAFVTLGLITQEKTLKRVERCCLIFFCLVFLASVIFVIRKEVMVIFMIAGVGR